MEHSSSAYDVPTIQETDLQNTVVRAIHGMLGEIDAAFPIWGIIIVEALSNDNSSEVSKIGRWLEELQ